jgi:hypothetical protein
MAQVRDFVSSRHWLNLIRLTFWLSFLLGGRSGNSIAAVMRMGCSAIGNTPWAPCPLLSHVVTTAVVFEVV